jgi:hypothetical protein
MTQVTANPPTHEELAALSGTEFFQLIATWSRRDLELAFRQALTNRAPQALIPENLPAPITATSTLEAMQHIMQALASGSMSAADAKARLYAHQIALSALRTIDTARNRRQKEARLCQTQTTTSTATFASPKKTAATASKKHAARPGARTKTSKTTKKKKKPA